MKITDSDIIKAGERELIDTIIGDLDWNAIEKIFSERHGLRIQDDVEYRQGDIVVHNDEVAYKLDFDVKLTLSILLNRAGKYLSFTAKNELPGETMENDPDTNMQPLQQSQPFIDPGLEFEETEPAVAADPGKKPSENMTAMASEISDMITEINAET
jgi:hypothetical protein